MLTNIKEEINSNIVIVGDFNIPLTQIERSSRQKINEDTVVLNNTIDQMDLIDISPQSSRRDILLKCAWNIFQDRPHVRPQNH